MLMALKRNQKGLTLIELLAVLVIVGIIAAIAIPAISGTIAKSKTKADAATVSMIKEAAMRYTIDTDQKATYTEDITKLTSEGYLNAAPTWNGTVQTKFVATLTGTSWSIELQP
ncbi:prepilin-type N-terminal cleavage/methylation domain-containing protein [Paenibacillus sp. 2TAB23]|uniref:prepilin-type N-terminal cleavage/methylation domain-containing protein n=1 Tax=Paenibacillus sp. 2TAB23 TaxID=3233004 RepID=UPI003F9ABF0F